MLRWLDNNLEQFRRISVFVTRLINKAYHTFLPNDSIVNLPMKQSKRIILTDEPYFSLQVSIHHFLHGL